MGLQPGSQTERRGDRDLERVHAQARLERRSLRAPCAAERGRWLRVPRPHSDLLRFHRPRRKSRSPQKREIEIGPEANTGKRRAEEFKLQRGRCTLLSNPKCI